MALVHLVQFSLQLCISWLFLSLTKHDIRFPGDSKDSANGETTGLSSKKSAATRMVTRLRNPESKLSQLKNQQVAAAVHEANKVFKEGKEVRRTVDDNDFAISDKKHN